jgi:hypothetical protein
MKDQAMKIETTSDFSGPRTGSRLLAGGVLIAIMAAWVGINHEPVPGIAVGLLATAALVSCAAGLHRMRMPSADSANRRKSAAGICAVIGVVVAGCGLWLAFQFKLAALGEALGLGLFALLAFVTAIQEANAGLSAADCWEKVRAWRAPIGIAIAALGVASLGSFFYLALVEKIGREFAPELIGLLIAGFAAFFSGMYIFISVDPPMPPETLRGVLAVLGMVIGGLLMLVSLGRGFFWFDEIFRGGLTGLSGDGGWRFWLVAYQFLAGIGLILAALSMWQSDVRSSASVRRTVLGYGTIVGGLLALILFVVGNVFVALKAPYTYNWSQTRGLASLNKASQNLLAGLTEPTTLYILMQPGGPLYTDIRNFAGNCQAYTNKITVTYVDPKNDPVKYNQLALRFKEIDPDTRSPFDEANQGVLIVYGTMPDDVKQPVPHAFIPERRLYEIDQKASRTGGGKATLILKAESEIIRELAFLADKSQKRKIYFLQGDGTLDINANDPVSRRNPSFELTKLGAGKLVDRLRKDNFDVRGLSFGVAPPKDAPKDISFLGDVSSSKKLEIPEDCDTLVVAGASSQISQAGLDAMERYMDQRGKMIVAFDVVTDPKFTAMRKSGMEDFVKKYGVTATDLVLYRYPQPQDASLLGNSFRDPRLVVATAPAKPPTLLAKQFLNAPVLFWSAREIRPGTSAKYQVAPFLQVDRRSSVIWADDTIAGLVDFERYSLELRRTGRLKELYSPEPIPVAVTVSEGTGETAKPRMVVFGDAEFMSNEDMTLSEINNDVVASSIDWMSEKSFVGPRPKESSTYSFGPAADADILQYGPIWTMLVVTAILGVGVWLVRRK